VSDPDRWPPCVRCGGCYQNASRWPEGRICQYCRSNARQREGICAGCGHCGVLPGLNPVGQATCVSCSGVPVEVCCRRCGTEAPMGRGHTCWRCRLTEKANTVLAGPRGVIPAQLPLADAIMAMPRANSGYVWLRNPRVQALLADLVAGRIVLDHAALDALPRSTTVEYIPGLLISTGLLPARDHYLAAFERWLDDRLAQIVARR